MACQAKMPKGEVGSSQINVLDEDVHDQVIAQVLVLCVTQPHDPFQVEDQGENQIECNKTQDHFIKC